MEILFYVTFRVDPMQAQILHVYPLSCVLQNMAELYDT